MIVLGQKLLLLFFAHFVADFPLQGDFLSKAKNPAAPLPGIQWQTAMMAHVTIHAGFVYLITGSMLLAYAEAFAHYGIDVLKCRGHLTFSQDQELHLGCKIVWAVIWFIWRPW